MNGSSDQLMERIAVRLKAMGNPIRLKILHALEDGELSVGQIANRVGSSQANASKQVGVLRGAGLFDSRREGVSVCDSLLDRAKREVEAIATGSD